MTASLAPRFRVAAGPPGRRDCQPAPRPVNGWIRNTLELGVLALSEQLRPAIEADPALEILGPPRALAFDEGGNLVDLLGAPLARDH